MKLQNFYFTNQLLNIKQRIRADDVNITYGRLNDLELNTMDSFELNSKTDWAQITHDPKTGAILDKQSNVIVVYIYDNTYHDLQTETKKLKRVHITWCTTLENMKEKGRYERYIATKNQDDVYTVNLVKDLQTAPDTIIETDRNLHPCQHCLGKTKIGGFDRDSMNGFERAQFVDNFKIKTWFDYCHDNGIGNNFSGSRKTKYTNTNAPQSEYTNDWNIVSQKYRKSIGWICEECSLDCSNHKRNLDTHHINGVKFDNNASNLKALCKDCHSKEPMHEHYRPRKVEKT